ncbi:folate ECF transporter [Clostridia bacterium]|nr:folate ECF transporter [Clostridia bacterium]
MYTFIKKIRQSAEELKNTYSLTAISLLIAMAVSLSFFSVQWTVMNRFTFSVLAFAVCAMWYGPIPTGILGILADLISFYLKGGSTGPYFFGFTLNGFLSGMIYGLFLYQTKFHPRKTLLLLLGSKLLNLIFIEMLLSPLWLSILYGKAWIVYFSGRLALNLIQYPIKVGLCYMLLLFLEKTIVKNGLIQLKRE